MLAASPFTIFFNRFSMPSTFRNIVKEKEEEEEKKEEEEGSEEQ